MTIVLRVNTLLVSAIASEQAQLYWWRFVEAHGDAATKLREHVDLAARSGAEVEALRTELIAHGIPAAALRVVETPDPSPAARLRAASKH